MRGGFTVGEVGDVFVVDAEVEDGDVVVYGGDEIDLQGLGGGD